MAVRELIPHKLVIEYDSMGEVKSGILLYRIRVDGVTQKKFNSISISGAGHSVPQFNAILKKFRDHAKKAENVEEKEG